MVEDVLPEVYYSKSGLRQKLLQAATDNSMVDMQKLLLDLTTTVVGYMAYDVCLDYNINPLLLVTN